LPKADNWEQTMEVAELKAAIVELLARVDKVRDWL